MSAFQDPRPRFHVAPTQGWINDPNGPIYYKGYYHMFYQYVETGCTWSWGLLWGHAVSSDLVTWQHLPPALAPTFGGFDGDGCFSGCATLDEEGVPTILYTGVRLRSSDVCGPLPPPECDLGTACIETQCLAWGDPADPKLVHWTKEEVPFLSLPPPNMDLTAWRDPYVIGRPGKDGQDCWTIMVGAGVKERGGTALVYRAQTLRGGAWSYAGELCRGKGDTGVIWECPVMLQLPRLPAPPALAVRAAANAAKKAQSPTTKTMAHTTAIVDGSPRMEKRNDPVQLLEAAVPESLPFLLSSPASPRPPVKLPDRIDTAGNVDAIWAAAAADAAAVQVVPPDGSPVALISPRRQTVSLPAAPPSPLRSPARWKLPSMHALPQPPSPPPPGPPGGRIASPMLPGPFSPTAAHRGVLPRRTPPPSPRQPLVLQTGGAGPTLTRGSPPSPAGPLSPAGSLASLLDRVPTSAAAPSVSPFPLPPTLTSPRAERRAAAAAPAIAAAIAPPAVTPSSAAPQAPQRTISSWQQHQTFFCVCPDDCNSMAVYYLGSFDPCAASFDLESALGPFPIDLGDIFYAPNTLTDPEGRCVLWGWLQEKPRKVGTYDYAGCLSMPRLLYLEVIEQAGPESSPTVHLVQRPPPEIAKLRVPGSGWHAEGLLLEPGSTLPVPLASGHHIELELTMSPLQLPPSQAPQAGGAGGAAPSSAASAIADGGGSRCSGVLLHSWRGGAEGAAALLYHWDSGVLEVVFEAMDPATLSFSLAAPGARRVGGRLLRPPAPGSPLTLRAFLDYSCLEVFTGAGEVLTARVYRGSGPTAATPAGPFAQAHAQAHVHDPVYGFGGAAAAGIELVSFGGSTEFENVKAYEVGSIWVEDV